MWLLEFHLAFSILCLITYLGAEFFLGNKETKKKYKEAFKEYDKGNWLSKCFANIKFIVGCFVPVINVIILITVLIVKSNPDWVIEKAKEYKKNNSLSNIKKEQLNKIIKEVNEVVDDKPVVILGEKSTLEKLDILAKDDSNIKG